MRPGHLPDAKKLAIALVTSYSFKKKLKTVQPQIFKKLRTVSLNLNLLVLIKKGVAVLNNCKN